MSDDNVISLGEKTKDATYVSPKQALEDALNDIGKRGAFEHGKKLLILALDDTQDNFSVSFTQAGMKMSECIALVECAKTIFLSNMNYIPSAE